MKDAAVTCDLDEIVDTFTPYDLYRHAYWRVRSRWRKQLWDWTRRDPCDASAVFTSGRMVAGSCDAATLVITLGATELQTGGRVAVYFPIYFGTFAMATSPQCFQGPDGETGYGSRITATASREAVELEVKVPSTGSVFTCVDIAVASGGLTRGDTITVLIGDPSCKLPVASESAGHFPFRVAVDYAGDGTYRPVRPNPTIETVGNRAVNFRVYAPATPVPGKPFSIRVVAADGENHSASWDYAGNVVLEAAEGSITARAPDTIPLDAHGSVLIEDVTVTTPDVTRIQVLDSGNSLVGQSNPVCPGAAPPDLQVFYGDIHGHSELSDGGGLPEDSYHWARDVEGLDFAALSDHPEDGQSYNYSQAEKWEITKQMAARFDEPGRFATLLGYEIGTLASHRNVYFRDGEGRMVVEGFGGEKVTMNNVFEKLEGTDYLLIPHASKYSGIDWQLPHKPARQRLIEICSFWGVSEAGGPLSVMHGLDLGYKFGFTGGTDNHKGELGNPTLGGITGLYAPALTREDVFDALKARRTFASTGPRMILTFEVNGSMMGSEMHLEQGVARELRARFITVDRMTRIDVVRNGRVVFTLPGDGRHDITLEWQDDMPLSELCPRRELTDERFAYYYVRVATAGGDYGWASPVWVHPAEP